MNQLHTGPLKPPPRRTADEVMQFLKRVVRLTGYDVKRRSPSREDFLASRHIDTIIDVGANIGQFGKEVLVGKGLTRWPFTLTIHNGSRGQMVCCKIFPSLSWEFFVQELEEIAHLDTSPGPISQPTVRRLK